MKVCFDIQPARGTITGIGRYCRCLAQAMAQEPVGHQFRTFYFDFRRRGLDFPLPPGVESPLCWLPGQLVQKGWRTLGWPPFQQVAGAADVYHFPNFIAPPVSGKGKVALTVHDLSFMRFAETLEAANLDRLRAGLRDSLARADLVLTISATVAQEIEAELGVPAQRIVPTLLGLEPHFSPPEATEVAAMRTELALPAPYLLSVGTLEPRKNHGFLVEVFETLRRFDGELVLAGQAGWKTAGLMRRIAESPLAARIRHLDYVPERLLPALYGGAELLCFPSLYEGFGFPPLEAMACGTPVVSSDAGSLKEVLEGGATLLHGFDGEEWREATENLLENSSARAQWRQDGASHAARFTWQRTARQTWNAFEQL